MTGISKPGSSWLPVRVDGFEAWQVSLLEESAQLLGAVLEPAGRIHRPYSVGSPVVFRGERAWLRVSTFLEHEMNPTAWRGTADAAAIPGVSKPALLHRIEWQASAPVPVPVSAEVLTLVTDPPASHERYLRTDPDLSDDWFRDLPPPLPRCVRTRPIVGSPFMTPRSTATCSARRTAFSSRLASRRPSRPSTLT